MSFIAISLRRAAFPDALIYKADFCLRLDLEEDRPEVSARFPRAIDHARIITSAVFDGSEIVTAVVSCFDGERRASRTATSFKALTEMGFRAEFSSTERVSKKDTTPVANHDEDLNKYWHSAEFRKTPHEIDAVLWVSIARETPLTQKAIRLESIYIVDFTRRIAATVYDDRGMDVIPIDRAASAAVRSVRGMASELRSAQNGPDFYGELIGFESAVRNRTRSTQPIRDRRKSASLICWP